MKHALVISLAACCLVNSAAFPALADDLEGLQGTWNVKKTNEQGQPYTQALEIKKDKFVFKITGSDKTVYLYAEGDLKLEKVGPFKAARFVNIKAGQSSADAQAIDEEYAAIYTLRENTWTMAANFDKEREQPPALDAYQRVKVEEPMTLVIDKIVMDETPQVATWYVCFEATAAGVTRKYNVPGKSYQGGPVTIPVDLSLPKVRKGQACSFTCKLDDVDEDACTEEVDNRSMGNFTVTESGSQAYKPEDRWRYTVYWHLK